MEEKQIKEGIIELDRFIGFKPSPDCLELRAWVGYAFGGDEVLARCQYLISCIPYLMIMFHQG